MNKRHDSLNGSQYPLGIRLAKPYNLVAEATLGEIVDLLHKAKIPANECVTKAQLRSMLHREVARGYILEKRQRILNDRLVAFRNQCAKLPEDDPINITFHAFLTALVAGMEDG